MRIAILGAGIAGLASALTLSGRGHAITVLEKRTGFGETGAGIQLSPNATRVLLALGLGPALARVSSEPDGIAVRSLRTGAAIGAVALGRGMRERYGAPFLALSRADLHTVLLDAARGRPDIRLLVGRGASVAEVDSPEAVVRAESAGGRTDELRVDLAVAADGLFGSGRAALGDRRRPRYAGYAAFRAAVPPDARPDGIAPGETGLWLGPGAHVVHYAVSGGRRLNLVAVARRPRAAEGWSADVRPGEVLAATGRACPALRRLLEAAEEWSAWSLFDLAARQLARGRLALLGDAAHPVLPYLAQGASLALEDAALLAARLGPDPASVPAALSRYAAERLARVRRVQDAARRNGRVYHARGPVALGRNLVMRRLGPDGMRARYDWLYGWTPPGPGA